MTDWEDLSPTCKIVGGDCIEVMRTMPDALIDAICTDPPYGIEFMGKEWDSLDGDAWRAGGGFTSPGIGDRDTPWASFGQGDTANATCATCGGRMRGARKCECPEPDWRVKGKPLGESDADSRQAQSRKMQEWHYAWACEAFRVLKPGGHLVAFGGTRTYHRLACAIEDAGFEIRDSIDWIYGSGFPKSLDVSKAIDRDAGVVREVVGPKQFADGTTARRTQNLGTAVFNDPKSRDTNMVTTAPATPESEKFSGFGTALKPAHEPIVLARKPLIGTVARNVLEYGTGALNIDGSRVSGIDPANEKRLGREYGDGESSNFGQVKAAVVGGDPAGRWPPNVLLSHADGCVKVGQRIVGADTHYPSSRGAGGGYKQDFPGQSELEESSAQNETVDAWECVEGCPVAELDRQSGPAGSNSMMPNNADGSISPGSWGFGERQLGPETSVHDTRDAGGASRFFPTFDPDVTFPFQYVPKAGRAEREQGLTSGPGAVGSVPPLRSFKTRECIDCGSRAKGDASQPWPTCGHDHWQWAEQHALDERETPMAGRGQPGLKCKRCGKWKVSGSPCECAEPEWEQSPFVRPTVLNTHPTVKPIDVMAWLCKLVTPPGGTILDPFLGSGTTGMAAVWEGFAFVGIEKNPDYVTIARARIEWQIRELASGGPQLGLGI